MKKVKKPLLRNTVSREEARQRLKDEACDCARRTISFYRYVKIADPALMRDTLFAAWEPLGVFGRIYVAHEGINAQLSLPAKNLEKFRELVDSFAEFKDVPFKYGLEEGSSFIKLTIKVRNYIVTDGLPVESYDVSNVGTHLTAEEFNEALQRKDTVVVDMRNNYESRIGRFEGAICPDALTFKQILPMTRELLKGKEDKKILLYCTGGIRCEKASSFLKAQGFADVSQLYGGIISYAKEAREKNLDCKFKGKNFVFDDRLGERVTQDVISRCDQCGGSCDSYTNCENQSCNVLFIQCIDCEVTYRGCCGEKCRAIQVLPEEQRRELRKNQPPKSFEQFTRRMKPKLRRVSN